MLDHDCIARRPGREPYDRAELIALMIRKYHAVLLATQQELAKRCCGDVRRPPAGAGLLLQNLGGLQAKSRMA